MSLHIARYFSSIERGNSRVLLNNLHRNVLLLDRGLYNNLEANKFSEIGEKYLDELIENKFLYYSKDDEFKEFLEWYKIIQHNLDTLNLCILTTSKCNLNCEYCYERDCIDLSSDVSDSRRIDSTIKLLESFYNYFRMDGIRIQFYGGEPLLNKNFMLEIITEINNSRDLDNTEIYYSIFTNGTLLTPDIVNFMDLNNFENVSISIDGTMNPDHQKRLFKDGRSSFHQTYNNLKYLHRTFKGKISVSIVADEDNYMDLGRFFKMLIDDGMNNLFVQIATVNPTVKDRCAPNDCYHSSEEQIKILNSSHVSAMRNGLKTNYLKSFDTGPCMLRRKNHLIITADGFLKKCIGLLGHDCFSLGKIEHASKDFEKFIRDLDEAVESTTIWDNKKCKSCKFLPLCLGGCRYISYLENNSLEEPYCHDQLIENSELFLLGKVFDESENISI